MSHLQASVIIVLAFGLALGQVAMPLTGPGITDLSTGGYWDADLGIVFQGPNNTWFAVEGDVLGSVQHARVPNAIGVVDSLSPSNFKVTWVQGSNGLATPFFPLLAQSTVPAGAITVNETIFIFMMNVADWRNGAPGNVSASGLLIQGWLNRALIPVFDYSPLWYAPSTAPLTNAAPVLYPVDSMIYVFGSGLYRASGLYLSRCTQSNIGILSSYQWWDGSTWASSYSQVHIILNILFNLQVHLK